MSHTLFNFLADAPVTSGDILSKLFPNIFQLIAHFIATTIIIILLVRFVWKPMKKNLKARREFIQSAIDDSTKNKESSFKMNEEATQNLIQSRLEAEKVLHNAKFEGYKVRETIISTAQQQAEKIRQDAADDIKSERAKLEQSIRQEIVDVAFDAAQQIVAKELDEKTNKKMIADYISKNKKGEN